MGRTSPIRHPAKDPLAMLRKCYLTLCDGDHCAAILLANFEYWHGVRIDQIEQEKARKRADSDYNENVTLWIYKTEQDLSQDDLLGLYGVSKVSKGLEVLHIKGFIDSRPNDGPGLSRTHQYLFLKEAVQASVESLILTNGSVENNDSEALKITTLNKEVEITSETTPGERDPFAAAQEETPEELYLDDAVDTFAIDAYRRVRGVRLKLDRRQDERTVEDLQQKESKMGQRDFRVAFLRFLARGDQEIRKEKWPLHWFLKNPEAYCGEMPVPQAPRAAERVDRQEEAAKPPKESSAAPQTAQTRDWLGEWNRMVPEQPTQHNPKKHLNLKVQEAGQDFRENFDKMVAAAKSAIAIKGPNVSYLNLYWLCKYADGETKPNWWHLLFGDHRHMAVASGANSEIGTAGPRPWVPGMLCETAEQLKARRVWQAGRREQGKHTDDDRAAREGDVT